jgi:putative membrane protein
MALSSVLGSIVYSLLGVLVMSFCFWVIDRLTPGHLWRELLEKQNTALAILGAGVAIAVGMIVSAAIH